MADAIRVRYAEWADNPFEFDRVPDWLTVAAELDRIKPNFGSEDYWYIDVSTKRGWQRIGPDDWIIYDDDGNLQTAKFNGAIL